MLTLYHVKGCFFLVLPNLHYSNHQVYTRLVLFMQGFNISKDTNSAACLGVCFMFCKDIQKSTALFPCFSRTTKSAIFFFLDIYENNINSFIPYFFIVGHNINSRRLFSATLFRTICNSLDNLFSFGFLLFILQILGCF